MPKISQFPAGGAAQNTDLIPVVRNGGDYTITGYNLAALASYGQAYTGTFTATAGQTVFTLPASPGSLANLAVSVDGAVMVPGTDYTWTTPTTLTFMTGLSAGQTVLYRYTTSVPVGTAIAGGVNGQLLYNNSGIVNGTTIGGDATLNASTGALTVTKTNGVAFAASATTNTTVTGNITYTQGGTGSTSRTVTAKLQESVSVLDFGADPTGASDSATAFSNALTASGNVVVPPGTYLVNSTISLTNNKTITFFGGASILAGANNLTVFKAATSAYYTQIVNPSINGNGKTGVVGFDMTNFRLQAGIINPLITACNNGFIFRTGCYATLLLNPSTYQTPYPAQLITNDGSVDVINPSFDNETGNGGTGAGIGIDVQASGSTTINARVSGGYIQGFQYGVKDAGYATKISDVYFEANSSSDVYASGAKYGAYTNTTHFGSTPSAYAVTLSSCDSITIFNPTMGSGNRAAVYNVDSSNTNCVEYHALSATSLDTPIGTLTYLSSIPRQIVSTFTPVVAGTTTAGTGTYTTQSGTVVQTGNQIHVQMEITWTAHTGTGNIAVTGIPSALAPSSYTPRRVGQVVPVLAFTGPAVYCYLNGSGTNLTLVQVATTGTQSLIPITASGTIYINMVYDL